MGRPHSLRPHALALLLPTLTLAVLFAGAELPRPYSWILFIVTGAMIVAIADRTLRVNERLRRVNDERRIFAALIDNSSDFIGIADPTGRPIYVNPAGRRMVALPSETRLEDTQIPEYYPPDQRTFVQDVIVKAMVEQGRWQGETQFRNWQTDAAIPVSDTHFMIRDPETGAVLGMGTITRDISDLRSARDEAETTHLRLLSLFESAPEGIFIADLDGRYTDVNAEGCRIVGYSREEILGMTILDLIEPADVPLLAQQKVQMLGGKQVVSEWMLRRKDGTHVPTEISAKILPDGRWQGFVRDITVRKRLENELAAKSADFERAQSVAQIGSWRLDIQRNELRWSDEAYRIFGVPAGTPMTYEAFLACVHPDDRAYVHERWSAALAGAPYDIEHRLLVAGQVRWVREKADLEFDARASLLGGIGITQDITERKRLEEQVQQAQERIELALNGADLAAWDWNVVTDETLFSPRWAEMRGYPAERTVESWRAGIHPEDLPRVERALEDHFAGRTPEYECEFRVETKSGTWLWVLDRGKVFARDAEGRPTRMLGTVLDITTRKRADTELRLAHETTSGILSISADAIISIDEDQRITMFNEGAAKIFGYTNAEAIGMPLERLLPERVRAKHHGLVDRFAAGPNTAKQMGTRNGELLGLRKNGDEFPAEAAISKLEVGGHKILTATVRDVTEQRRVEHEQRFLAEAGPILASSLEYKNTLDQVARLAVREVADLCIIDIVSDDGQIRRLKAVCRDPSKAWIADRLTQVSLDPDRPYLTKSPLANHQPMLIERMTDEILRHYTQTEEHLNLLRALKPTSFIAVPLLAHGKLLGAIALVSAATSPRFGWSDVELAQELARRAALAIESARLYGAAQQAIKARDDVLAVVAHDLRNPLNAVLLQADMLGERKAGDAIKRSVMRMNRLIQDILDVTRLEAGQLTVDCKRVSTVQALLDLVEAQRPLAEARGLALLLEVTPDIPDLWADRDRFHQICENLIGNALKFTTHGNVTLGATARDGDVLLWVKDTGSGVAPDALPHIFDRFWKSDADVQRGAGLGLAIVKGLVEAHGGKIWAESTPNVGSCFYFTIPQAPPIDAREAAAEQARTPH